MERVMCNFQKKMMVDFYKLSWLALDSAHRSGVLDLVPSPASDLRSKNSTDIYKQSQNGTS